jgi:ABC-type bacteriocin/lantibiotic exporter with double-glycine peptidase domain
VAVEEGPTDAFVSDQVARDLAEREPAPKLTVSWVRYQYPGHTDDALAEVSFTVPAGGCVALVGPSGAGKSTLLRLLRGQLDPTSGSIRYDEQDTWRTDPALRHRIALVPTKGLLTDSTLARNISQDRPSARHVEVVEAARSAGVLGFVDGLTDGFNTRLGADGAALTAGQRRRILIARALLMKPDVLLMDEPTSGLVSRERHELIGELCQLATDHTMVLATQDPLVIALADEVIELARPTAR